jgi:scyllo-inositol 2-dehydrogenase (NADP+)
MKKIVTGIIGFGLSGRYFFAPYLATHPGFEIKAIVTSQTGLVKELYPDAEVYRDPLMLLNDRAIDLVIVASPNYTHYGLAREALLAGKNVIVEKPFTVTSTEADELILLSKRQNKLVIPFQNRRWDGDFLTIKKLIKDGTLGDILEFESHFDRYRPDKERVEWKNQPNRGVGQLYDLGPHLIDQALCLFGKPEYVYGDIRRHRLQGFNDDYFEIQLHYRETKVILKAGVMGREIGPRFIVHGRKGSFIKYGLDVQEQNLKNGLLPGNPLLTRDKEEHWGLLHTEIDGKVIREPYPTVDGNYMKYFDNVYHSIMEGEEPIVKPEQGKMIIRIIEKAILSSHEKRMVKMKE